MDVFESPLADRWDLDDGFLPVVALPLLLALILVALVGAVDV